MARNGCNYTLNQDRTGSDLLGTFTFANKQFSSWEYMFMYAVTCSYCKIRKGEIYVNGSQTMCTCNMVPDEASVPQC